MAAARFIVEGRVQGVHYRAATRTRALALGQTGSAVNRADGTVEVIATFGNRKLVLSSHT